MNKHQTLQNIWAMTDKTVIDMMTKKPSANDSADDNSDLESVDSRYSPFVAVPKEFRPPLTVRTKTEHAPMSLNENKQVLSNQNPVSASKPSASKAAFKVPPNPKPPLFTNSKPSFLQNPRPPLLPNPKPRVFQNPRPRVFQNPRPPLLQNPRPPLLQNPRPPLLQNPRPASMECKRIPNRNETSIFKEDLNNLKHPQNLKKYHHVANDTITAQKNTDVKKNPGVNGKTSLQPPNEITHNSLPKCNEVLSMKGPKHENDKKGIKYEYVGKQEHTTVKLNFEMPPTSNLQEQKIMKEEIMKKVNKNFRDGIEREFNKDTHTIKWVGSLNSGEENSDAEGKTERVFGKVTHRVLYQENVVKWDSSLNREDLNTKDKTERDFVRDGNWIKWHSSLNLKDSSSDSDGKIEWTVIQEKKTIISAKKIEGKDHTHKQTNNKCLPTKPNTQNESAKPKRRQRRKYFNKNMKQPKNDHRKNTPKPNHKDPENLVYKNDLQLNNNLKHDRNEIRHSNTRDESSPDAETFTRQCRVSEQNFDSSEISPSLSNDKPEFTMCYTAKNSCESNSSSEKIDNITLKRIEEQKESMLNYGREISDLIIGSYSALSVFMSIFNEWKRSRLELINNFQYLENNLKESGKKFTKYKDMLSMVKTGATIAAAVPLPHVSIAARVISVLTGLFSGFLSSTEKKKAEVEDSNEMSIAATRDTSASTDLYMFGLQCGQNFEETAKSIEEFHSNVADLEKEIFEKDSPEIATFIRGVLEYRPRHRIFYKKLHRCFQELLENCSSEFGKRFCEPFLLNSPGTIDVVEFLNWRFLHEDFNGESVRYQLQQIDCLIQGNDTSIKELTVRIQTCIGILQDELKFIEGRVKDLNLFDKSVQF